MTTAPTDAGGASNHCREPEGMSASKFTTAQMLDWLQEASDIAEYKAKQTAPGDVWGVMLKNEAALARAVAGRIKDEWRPIATAPRDGHPILATDGSAIRVCYPKIFPRKITQGDDMSTSKPGDVWEWFRDERFIPGHSWSMVPTHWKPLDKPPEPA